MSIFIIIKIKIEVKPQWIETIDGWIPGSLVNSFQNHAGAGTRCMSLLSPPPYLFIFGLSFKNPTTKSSIKRCYRITAYPNAGSRKLDYK